MVSDSWERGQFVGSREQPRWEPSGLYVDLSVVTSSRHLAAALLLGRASGQPIRVLADDLNHAYWLSGGIVAGLYDNEMIHSFRRFFSENHEELQGALPGNPQLGDPTAGLVLMEHALSRDWAELDPGEWGVAEMFLDRLFTLPETALEGFRYWEGSLQGFLEQSWVGDDHDWDRVPMAFYEIGADASTVVTAPTHCNDTVRAALRELVRVDTDRHRDAGWVVQDFARLNNIGSAFRYDLRAALVVGLWALLDGRGDLLTRSASIGDLLRFVGARGEPLDAHHPALAGSLARGLLEVDRATPVEAVIGLLENAPALQLVNTLIGLDNEIAQRSVRAYIASVSSIVSPKPIRILNETRRLLVRRRQARRRSS